MTDAIVIAFPKRQQDFEAWCGWAECELSILGFEMADTGYDWRAAFEHGLKPEDAAAEAAKSAKTGQRPTKLGTRKT